MRICFDMDGTIADLYGVNNWLEYLLQEDETPYIQAKTLLNMNTLARLLNKLQQRKGYKIGIVSWLSKDASQDYAKRIISAKKTWLAKHLHSVHFDFIEIIPYGTSKEQYAETLDDILFDDDIHNRDNWTGVAYDVHNILEILKTL